MLSGVFAQNAVFFRKLLIRAEGILCRLIRSYAHNQIMNNHQSRTLLLIPDPCSIFHPGKAPPPTPPFYIYLSTENLAGNYLVTMLSRLQNTTGVQEARSDSGKCFEMTELYAIAVGISYDA